MRSASEVAVAGLMEQRQETGKDPFTRVRLKVLRERCLEEGSRLLDLRVRVTNQADEPVPDGAIIYLLPDEHSPAGWMGLEAPERWAGKAYPLATAEGEVAAAVVVPAERTRVSLTVLYGPLVKTFEIGLARTDTILAAAA